MTKIYPMDELRNEGGDLASRVLVNRWPKPERVRLLNRMSEKRTLADLAKPQPTVSEATLEFSWLTKDDLRIDSLSLVTPRPTLLKQFIDLKEADDSEIQTFAEKYGGLFVYCLWFRSKDMHRCTVREFCEVWRYFASAIGALLNIAATIGNRKAGTPDDWERIGRCPPVMREYQSKGRFDFVSGNFLGEEAWTAMAHYVARGSNRDWPMWTSLLNSLLYMGRVHPFVFFERSSNNGTPSITFGVPSLLSHLAFQTCLLAVRRDGFAVCSYCRSPYLPRQRAPKAGQRNFCEECKNKKVPARLWQQDRRANKRLASSSAGFE